MSQFRVGEAGATVFNEAGEAIATLRPGAIVVEGRLKELGSKAEQYQRGDGQKMRRARSDKSLRAGRDYSDKGAG